LLDAAVQITVTAIWSQGGAFAGRLRLIWSGCQRLEDERFVRPRYGLTLDNDLCQACRMALVASREPRLRFTLFGFAS
jgi:hypothetical protein